MRQSLPNLTTAVPTRNLGRTALIGGLGRRRSKIAEALTD